MKYSTIKMCREKVDFGRKSAYLPAVRFIDSFRFISKSLSGIVETMKDKEKDNEVLKKKFPQTWHYLNKVYGKSAEEIFPFATEKGLIAYDKINIENLKHKGNLPMTWYNNSLDMVVPDKKTSRSCKYMTASLQKIIGLIVLKPVKSTTFWNGSMVKRR